MRRNRKWCADLAWTHRVTVSKHSVHLFIVPREDNRTVLRGENNQHEEGAVDMHSGKQTEKGKGKMKEEERLDAFVPIGIFSSSVSRAALFPEPAL